MENGRTAHSLNNIHLTKVITIQGRIPIIKPANNNISISPPKIARMIHIGIGIKNNQCNTIINLFKISIFKLYILDNISQL